MVSETSPDKQWTPSLGISIAAATARNASNTIVTERYTKYQKSQAEDISMGEPDVNSDEPREVGLAQVRNFTEMLNTGTDNDLRQYFIKIKDDLGQAGICSPCWLYGKQSNHKIEACTKVAAGYTRSGSKFRGWKASFNLPVGQCFKCCLPQVFITLSYY